MAPALWVQLVVLGGPRACRQGAQPQMGVGWSTARVRGWGLALLCGAQGVEDVGGAHCQPSPLDGFLKPLRGAARCAQGEDQELLPCRADLSPAARLLDRLHRSQIKGIQQFVVELGALNDCVVFLWHWTIISS